MKSTEETAGHRLGDDVDRETTIFRLRETVTGIVMIGQEEDRMASGLEGEGSIENQSLSTSDPEIWMQEQDPHVVGCACVV